jgi:hypothetical protein
MIVINNVMRVSTSMQTRPLIARRQKNINTCQMDIKIVTTQLIKMRRTLKIYY